MTTPLTDVLANAYVGIAPSRNEASAYLAHARDLERELAVVTAEAAKLRGALEHITNLMPCHDQGGGLFYPRHDGDGEYIGDDPVDPMTVLQNIDVLARAALARSQGEGANAAGQGREAYPAPACSGLL